jgi:hypothetical protein
MRAPGGDPGPDHSSRGRRAHGESYLFLPRAWGGCVGGGLLPERGAPRSDPSGRSKSTAYPQPSTLLPWPPGREPAGDPRVEAIAEAARALDETRGRWLNPPDAGAAELKQRTLTTLYNERPTWLRNLHAALDRAVWAAYVWADEPGETTDEQKMERLLTLNGERAATHETG